MTIHSLLINDREPPLTEEQKARKAELYGFGPSRKEFQEQQKDRCKRDDHILLKKDAEDGYTARHWESVMKATHRELNVSNEDAKKQKEKTKNVIKFLSSSSMAFGPGSKHWYEDKSVTQVDYDEKHANRDGKKVESNQGSQSVEKALTFTEAEGIKKQSDYANAFNGAWDEKKYKPNAAYQQYAKYLRGTHFQLGNGVAVEEPNITINQSSYRVLPAIAKPLTGEETFKKKQKGYTSRLFRPEEQAEEDRVQAKDNVSVFTKDYVQHQRGKLQTVDQAQLNELRASHFKLGTCKEKLESDYNSHFRTFNNSERNSVVKPDYKSYVFQFETNDEKPISCAKAAFTEEPHTLRAKEEHDKDLGKKCKKLFAASSVRFGNNNEYVKDRQASVTTNDYPTFNSDETAKKAMFRPLPSYPLFTDDNEDYKKGGSTCRDSYIPFGVQPVEQGESKGRNQKTNLVLGLDFQPKNSIYAGDFKDFDNYARPEGMEKKKPYRSNILNPSDDLEKIDPRDHYTSVQMKAFREVSDAKVVPTKPIKPQQGGNHYFHEGQEGDNDQNISECHDKFIKPERMDDRVVFKPQQYTPKASDKC
eukprot:Nk52_evm156s226 gene=Nk52_evmTU156s226